MLLEEDLKRITFLVNRWFQNASDKESHWAHAPHSSVPKQWKDQWAKLAEDIGISPKELKEWRLAQQEKRRRQERSFILNNQEGMFHAVSALFILQNALKGDNSPK